MNNLNDLLKLLLENKIDFVLIGGFAGVVHGSIQVTRDLDICAALDSEGVQKLRECLKELHPRHRMNPGFKPSFLEEPKDTTGLKNLYLETDLGILDVISEVTGLGALERLKAQSVSIGLFGFSCKVISIEDLITAKESLGRDKDRLVAKELKALLELKKEK